MRLHAESDSDICFSWLCDIGTSNDATWRHCYSTSRATPPPPSSHTPSSHTPSSHTPLKSKIANNLSWHSTWGKLWSSVYEQISQHIFVQNVVTMFIILQIFFVTSVIWKLRNVTRVFPRFAWGVFSHVTRLDDSRACGNIWWIITLNLTLVTLTVSIQHSICREKC